MRNHLAVIFHETVRREAADLRLALAWLAEVVTVLSAWVAAARPGPGGIDLGLAPEMALATGEAARQALETDVRRLAQQAVVTSRQAAHGANELMSSSRTAFAAHWHHPVQARLAASLFMTATALAAVGVGFAIGLGSPQASATSHLALGAPGRVAQATAADSAEATVPVPAPDRQTPAEPAAAPAPPPPPPPTPVPPNARGALPAGKGMWIWLPEQVEGGDPHAIVARSRAVGLTHLYVRTGSSKMGFYAQDFLNRLLPVAHANGIRVYGWDFPYFTNAHEDAMRSLAAISYTTPDGHRIDGFAADVETKGEGTNITGLNAEVYGRELRKAVGPNYPLIAVVPRPSSKLIPWFPYGHVTASFDAIAPMVYWLNREPVGDTIQGMEFLRQFNKPIIPVGQSYDGAREGGRPGVPPREELLAFMRTAESLGASGVSFWSWQHADQQAWDAIRDAVEFRLPAHPAPFTPAQVKAYQTLLNSLGFSVGAADGTWGPATQAAVTAYQQAALLPVTGVIDDATRALLLTPIAAPIQPQP